MNATRSAIALLTALPAAAQGATFSVIATLPGATPMISMVRDHAIYGIDPAAGPSGAGTLFRLDHAGTATVLHSFNGTDGSRPNARLAVDHAGNIFGTTQYGGSTGNGTVFELSQNGAAFTSLYSFGGAPDGAVPLDGLAINDAGTLFGTTSMGDNDPGSGEVFSITPAGGMHVLYKFVSGADGHCPFTGVVIGRGNALDGTVVGYGFGGQPQGAIYAFSQSSATVKPLYAFTDGADGEYPTITPTRDKTGNLYGVSTIRNGNAYDGAVWTYTATGPAKGFHLLHSFTGGVDGAGPNGPLLLGHDGDLYGTNSSGADGYGTVFRIAPSGLLTVLHSFSGGADGTSPTGGLAQDGQGNLYGGTASGTVFEITP